MQMDDAAGDERFRRHDWIKPLHQPGKSEGRRKGHVEMGARKVLGLVQMVDDLPHLEQPPGRLLSRPVRAESLSQALEHLVGETQRHRVVTFVGLDDELGVG